MKDRRNPYVVLGLPFGASRSEALIGFARAQKNLRSGAHQYGPEDFTWALHQIEQILLEPELALEVYRVPADPELFEEPDSFGLFNPAPVPSKRTTSKPREPELEALRRSSLTERLRALITAGRLTLPLPYETGEQRATPTN